MLFRIELWMRMGKHILLGLLGGLLTFAQVAGSFRGTVVESDESAVASNWLYVQGRNHTIRRVEISHARVEYDEAVPSANRKSKPERSLVAGTEVRVTAEQGKDGEWRASRVEILGIAEANPRQKTAGKN